MYALMYIMTYIYICIYTPIHISPPPLQQHPEYTTLAFSLTYILIYIHICISTHIYIYIYHRLHRRSAHSILMHAYIKNNSNRLSIFSSPS